MIHASVHSLACGFRVRLKIAFAFCGAAHVVLFVRLRRLVPSRSTWKELVSDGMPLVVAMKSSVCQTVSKPSGVEGQIVCATKCIIRTSDMAHTGAKYLKVQLFPVMRLPFFFFPCCLFTLQ